MAKAPVAGLAKTRLAAVLGGDAAAALAAAGFLDTLDACAPADDRILALTGDLSQASQSEQIQAGLTGWTIVAQRGEGFAERLANAHRDAGPGPVIQIGTDTPQVSSADLEAVASALNGHDAVLGEATDGGWWVLGRHDPEHAQALLGVPMSTNSTGAATRAALVALGLRVGSTAMLRDVDTIEDAQIVAAQAPQTRFAAQWAQAWGQR